MVCGVGCRAPGVRFWVEVLQCRCSGRGFMIWDSRCTVPKALNSISGFRDLGLALMGEEIWIVDVVPRFFIVWVAHEMPEVHGVFEVIVQP